MNAEEFVRLFYQERKDILDNIFKNEMSNTVVSHAIRQMNLDENNTERLKGVFNTLLTDTFYTILLGLDGSASIGKEQHSYKIWNEDDEEFIGDIGDIEVEAYESLCTNKYELKESDADFIALLYLENKGQNKEPLLRNGDIISIQTNRSEELYLAKIQLIERYCMFAGESVNSKLYLDKPESIPGFLQIGTNIKIYKDDILIGTGQILLDKNSVD